LPHRIEPDNDQAGVQVGETGSPFTRRSAKRQLILIIFLAATGIVLLFFVTGGPEITQLLLMALGFILLLGAVLVAGHKVADMNKAKSEPRDLP
jgi:hypothetical protein